MSEAELHVLRARLQGGILSKARRGELRLRLPIGLSYDAQGEVILDPDQQIQGAVRLLFETFNRSGSATATVKYFRQQRLKFPRRPHTGPSKGELLWTELGHSHALRILHNPRYAGAFVFGRSRTRHGLDGQSSTQRLARDQWRIVLPEVHAGYISWTQFERNQQRLLANAQARGLERRNSPPREGPALLQGLVLCGVCGQRMTVRYGSLNGQEVPHYMCQRQGIEHAKAVCQHIPGATIDAAVGELLLETVTPIHLELALAIEQELHSRLDEADALRRQQVERRRYEAEQTRRRYLRVDPDNRLVADALEADWNGKLRALEQAQQDYEQQRQADRPLLDKRQHQDILALANDFPRVWNNPRTTHRERKRLLRLLIEDVTLIKAEQIIAHVRFKGGAAKTLSLPRAKNSWQLRQTKPQVIEEIDHLLEHYTDKQISQRLNEKALSSGWERPFTSRTVARLRKAYGLKSRHDRLRHQGMLTQEEIAHLLGISVSTVKVWRRQGLLQGYAYTDKGEFLYEPPAGKAPQIIPVAQVT